MMMNFKSVLEAQYVEISIYRKKISLPLKATTCVTYIPNFNLRLNEICINIQPV
jgi:hypothetical protein